MKALLLGAMLMTTSPNEKAEKIETVSVDEAHYIIIKNRIDNGEITLKKAQKLWKRYKRNR